MVSDCASAADKWRSDRVNPLLAAAQRQFYRRAQDAWIVRHRDDNGLLRRQVPPQLRLFVAPMRPYRDLAFTPLDKTVAHGSVGFSFSLIAEARHKLLVPAVSRSDGPVDSKKFPIVERVNKSTFIECFQCSPAKRPLPGIWLHIRRKHCIFRPMLNVAGKRHYRDEPIGLIDRCPLPERNISSPGVRLLFREKNSIDETHVTLSI